MVIALKNFKNEIQRGRLENIIKSFIGRVLITLSGAAARTGKYRVNKSKIGDNKKIVIGI